MDIVAIMSMQNKGHWITGENPYHITNLNGLRSVNFSTSTNRHQCIVLRVAKIAYFSVAVNPYITRLTYSKEL